MGCRVGITTDPESRKEDWERDCPGLKNWRIIAEGLSRSAAQKKEDEYEEEHDCEAYRGGRNPEPENDQNNWSVYRFDY